MWDPFLMKKLIKNEICGSVNSAYVHCSLQKVNICGYCSLNSNRNTPKRVKTKKKKKKRTKRSLETQTWNPNTHLVYLNVRGLSLAPTYCYVFFQVTMMASSTIARTQPIII